jgi:hypothetical protein
MPSYVPQFSHRVVDPNLGTEVAADLVHPHQTKLSLRALQAGMTSSAALGSMTVPLYDPRSNEAQLVQDVYGALKVGQRIETYLGGAGSVGPYASSVITHIEKKYGPWLLTCADSLIWLEQSHLFPGETIGPSTAPARLVQLLSGTREVVYDQWLNTGTQPVISGSFTNVAADPQFGLQGVSTTAVGLMLESTSWNASAQYNWPTLPSDAYASGITVWGTIAMDTNVGNSGGIGLMWLSDATGANAFLAEAVTSYSGAAATGWNVSVKIWTESASAFTLQASVANVFTGLLSSSFPYQFSVTLTGNNSTGHIARLFLNGKDTGCAATISQALLNATSTAGRIGIRPTSSGATVYVNRVRMESRTGQYGSGTWGTNRFQVGSAASTTALVPFISAQNQTHIDVIQEAMALDGFQCLKTPVRAGLGSSLATKTDILTYGVLGVDRSGPGAGKAIVLREGDNVTEQGTIVGPAADTYATSTRYMAVPGDTSGGTVEWPGGPLASPGDIVVSGTVTDVAAPGVSLQLGYAMQVAARQATPTSAYQVVTEWSPDLEALGLYDRVLVDLPTLRVNRQSLQVLGIDLVEGRSEAIVILNQFPLSRLPQRSLANLTRTVRWLAQVAT